MHVKMAIAKKKGSALHQEFWDWKLLWFIGENLYLDLSDIQEMMKDTQEFMPGKSFHKLQLRRTFLSVVAGSMPAILQFQ